MSWAFKYNGENFRVLYCPLHNTIQDDLMSARLTFNHWKGSSTQKSQTFIDFSLPFLPREQVASLLEVLLHQRDLSEIQSIRSVKDMRATGCWFSQLSHMLHPKHVEKYKKEIRVKKVAGTPYRTVKYKELFAVVGRVLADPLKDNGWKNTSPVKVVIGKNDWYLRCKLQEVPKWSDGIYAFQAGQAIEAVLEKTPWWEEKDKTLLFFLQGAAK